MKMAIYSDLHELIMIASIDCFIDWKIYRNVVSGGGWFIFSLATIRLFQAWYIEALPKVWLIAKAGIVFIKFASFSFYWWTFHRPKLNRCLIVFLLIDWLAIWLIDWLFEWLILCLTDSSSGIIGKGRYYAKPGGGLAEHKGSKGVHGKALGEHL